MLIGGYILIHESPNFDNFRRRKNKMAESRQDVLREPCEYLSSFLKYSLKLKPEQRKAVQSLLEGNDVPQFYQQVLVKV